MRNELYYAIVNIVDYLALAEVDNDEERELYRILDKLLRFESECKEADINETFDAIADANDVGGVKSWQEMVKEMKELFKNGERV